jgi:hypothetical protein
LRFDFFNRFDKPERAERYRSAQRNFGNALPFTAKLFGQRAIVAAVRRGC